MTVIPPKGTIKESELFLLVYAAFGIAVPSSSPYARKKDIHCPTE
ncbi:hypothetical protein Barb4_01760 [Bacteroidales bacterium Barb4]|nr:hypothetical protein Barb4_01760 [Bacteroidales bacterium Barb4]